VRDIARADDMEELAELAWEIPEDLAEKSAADAPERTATTPETTASLFHIQVGQEPMPCGFLGDKHESLLDKDPCLPLRAPGMAAGGVLRAAGSARTGVLVPRLASPAP
jgi:hypothetical protein